MLFGLTGCSDSVKEAPLPDGVTMDVDQSRIQRKGREVFLRVRNDTKNAITIERFVLSSTRLDDVKWSGNEKIGASYEADLEFIMPSGRCGSGFKASVRLTYRVGGGDLQESTGTAKDPYGNAALFMDRDCAQITLGEAASIEAGEPTITGTGRGSVLKLPVTLTPTGKREGVRFGGFESTVLFRQAPSSASDVDIPLGADDPPARVVMAVVPSRCDPHALAEDKVGRLFGMKVLADGLSEGASFYLPLKASQRVALFDFFRSHCGLP